MRSVRCTLESEKFDENVDDLQCDRWLCLDEQSNRPQSNEHAAHSVGVTVFLIGIPDRTWGIRGKWIPV